MRACMDARWVASTSPSANGIHNISKGWSVFFFSSRRRHTRLQDDWSSDVCSSDLLRACMQVYARIVTMDFGMCLIRVGDEQVPPDSRRELRRQKAAIDQAFRRLVAAGVQEGSLAPCDPKMTAFVIAGALSWIGRWYQPGGQYSAEEVAQQCIDTLMGGVLRRADVLDTPKLSKPPKVGKPAKRAKAGG